MRVNWSANFCLFEKIENLKEIDDDRTDLYQRALTIEGKDYQIRNGIPTTKLILDPLNSTYKRRHPTKQAPETSPQHKSGNKEHSPLINRGKHVRNATIENIIIARMSLLFKVDDQDRIWFLFCTSLRVQPFEDQVIVLTYLALPEKDRK